MELNFSFSRYATAVNSSQIILHKNSENHGDIFAILGRERWKKLCIFLLLFVLTVAVIFNLVLTLHFMRVLRVSSVSVFLN